MNSVAGRVTSVKHLASDVYLFLYMYIYHDLSTTHTVSYTYMYKILTRVEKKWKQKQWKKNHYISAVPEPLVRETTYAHIAITL